jgi:LTXXQ motif family protein
MLKASGKQVSKQVSSVALAAIFAGAVAGLVFATAAQAGPGGGHGGGGGFHGGGGGFHGGGGGFHGGGGGFHGGGGGFHGGGMHAGGFHGGGGFRGGGMNAGGPRGGGFHAMHHAPRMGAGGGRFQGGHPARSFAGGNGRGGIHDGPHAPSGIAAGNRAGPGNRAVSNRVMQRNTRAVGQALSSRQIRSAMHTPGGLRNPATRAAITGAVAGAAFAHHHGGLWWRHAHGGFGWVGPVFWPYAYDDFYDYAWWGGGYDPFWEYGYGDLYAGLFGPYNYGALSAYAAYLPGSAGSPRQARARGGPDTTATLAEMCGSDSRTIAGLPVEQFRNAIQPNGEQAAALDDLANASQKASETIRNSCPKDVALTAPSRLAAMQQRVEAMRDGVNSVKPALDRFYGLLSDEQKAKITALAAEQRSAQREQTASTGGCSAAQPGATEWPSEAIERNVRPTDAQLGSLAVLQDATAKAADILKSSCPPTEARTPLARLDAVSARLDTMLQAIGTVRPALDTFYNALADEQKAAFDAIGPERGGATTASAADEDNSPRRAHRRHRHGISVGGMIFRMMRM